MKPETDFLTLVKRNKLLKKIFMENRKATLQNPYIEPFLVVYLEKNMVKIDW